jgi:hypothetical protein
MNRELLNRLGFVWSTVRRYYGSGLAVRSLKRGTSVLRFRDPQPIGRKDRQCQAQGVRHSVLRDTGVACPNGESVRRLSGNAVKGL